MCVLAGMETWRLLCGSPSYGRIECALGEGFAGFLPHGSCCDSLVDSDSMNSQSSSTMLPTEAPQQPSKAMSKGMGYNTQRACSETKAILSTLCSGCWHTSLSHGCIRVTCRQLRMCLRREQTLLAASLRTSGLIGERILRKSRAAIGLVSSRSALARWRNSQGQPTEVPHVSLVSALRAFGFAYSGRTWEEPDEREVGWTLKGPRPEAELVTDSWAYTNKLRSSTSVMEVLTRTLLPSGVTRGQQAGSSTDSPSASVSLLETPSECPPPLNASQDSWDYVLTDAIAEMADLSSNLLWLSVMGQLGLVEVWEHSSSQVSPKDALVQALRIPGVARPPPEPVQGDRLGRIMAHEMAQNDGRQIAGKVWSFMDLGSDLTWGENGNQVSELTLLHLRRTFKQGDTYQNPPTVAFLVKKSVSSWAVLTVLLANQTRAKFREEEICARQARLMSPRSDLVGLIESSIRTTDPVVIPDLMAQVCPKKFMTEGDIALAEFDAHYLRKKKNHVLRAERPEMYAANHSFHNCHWDLFTWNHQVWKDFLEPEIMAFQPGFWPEPEVTYEAAREWDLEASVLTKMQSIPANHDRTIWQLNELFERWAVGDRLSSEQEQLYQWVVMRIVYLSSTRQPELWRGMRRRDPNDPDW